MNDQDDHELSVGARALIDEVREVDGPAPGDRDRVKRALVAAIAGGASLAASTAASTAAAGTTAATATAAAGGLSLGVKIAAVALVAAALGGTALVVTAPPEPAPAPRRAAVHAPARPSEPEILRPAIEPAPPATVAPEPVAAEVAEELPAPEVVASAEVPDVAPRVRRAPAAPLEIARVDSTLTEELALLRDAQRAMQADHPHDALSRLDDHARRFPSGVLEEEREAARVLALCRADRADEARALAERFLRERPSSPHRARVRAACP